MCCDPAAKRMGEADSPGRVLCMLRQREVRHEKRVGWHEVCRALQLDVLTAKRSQAPISPRAAAPGVLCSVRSAPGHPLPRALSASPQKRVTGAKHEPAGPVCSPRVRGGGKDRGRGCGRRFTSARAGHAVAQTEPPVSHRLTWAVWEGGLFGIVW